MGCLTDFGLSKSMGFGGKSHSFVGTPDYLAPEVLMQTGHSAEVDWWALGVMICEMVAGIGNTPFYAELDHEIHSNIVKAKPILPDNSSASLTSLLTGLLTKLVDFRLGCEKKGGTKAVQAHEWFSGIDWEELSSYSRSAPENKIQAPWKPTEDLAHDTVLAKLRSKKKPVEEAAPKDSFDQWGSYVAPDAQHKKLSTNELAEVAALLVTVLEAETHEEAEQALTGFVMDEASFILQGIQYEGMAGILEYNDSFRKRFANVVTDVTSVHRVRQQGGTEVLEAEFTMSALYLMSSMQIDVKGIALARISEGKLGHGILSFSLQDAIEKQLSPNWQPTKTFNVMYGTLQLQVEKCLAHLEAVCSDVRSILKASVEEVFAPDVVMFDPRFEELLHGQAAVATALVGLSRLYEKRSYKIDGTRFLSRENGNQVIEMNMTFNALTRTDPRSMATFKKMRRFNLAPGTESRRITLPIIMRMEFDNLKCVRIDRVYRLTKFMEQLGGQHPAEDLKSVEPTATELRYIKALVTDQSQLESLRLEVTNHFAEALKSVDAMSTFCAEFLGENVDMVDPILVEKNAALQALGKEDFDVQSVIQNSAECSSHSGPMQMYVGGKAQVCEALINTVRFDIDAADVVETGSTAEMKGDFGEIHLHHDVTFKPSVMSQAVTHARHFFIRLCFEPSSRMIRHIYVQYYSAHRIIEKLGLGKVGLRRLGSNVTDVE